MLTSDGPGVSDSRASRVLFYGVTGSGKSTAAERLAGIVGLPYHPVDELTWMPGWVMVPDGVQRQRIEEICRTDRWVLDTAYSRWADIPLARVEMIIGLDYPRWLSLGRLVRRTLARVIDKKPVCNGNYETWRGVFSSDSIIRWHFASFRRKRDRMRGWAEDPGGRAVVLFRRPQDLERWLDSMAAGEMGAGRFP